MLKIEETIDTPSVSFDPESAKLELAGKSYPENTLEFYIPVLKWLDEFAAVNTKPTEFNFKLIYFNSSSYKPILDMLSKMDEMKSRGADVQVNWYYKSGDIDMREAGEEFAELFNFKFSFAEM